VGQIDRELSWPESGRLAGVDYGTVRIGVAICDPSRTWTSPLLTVHRQPPAKEASLFQKLVHENQIVGWVVGLPIHCDGRDSAKAQEASGFAQWLAQITRLPIRFVDERFSTAMANRLLRDAELTHKQRKKQVDKIAALVILDAYLESSKHPNYRPITLENLGDAYVSLDH
jgi:putative Holliday junction resolvase